MSEKATKLALIKRSFALAFNNIWRNKFLTLATVFVMGTIIFIFNVILTINFISQNALAELNKKVDITVYLQKSTSTDQAQSIINDLQNLEGVTNVTYTSKEDALNQVKTTHPEITLAFEKYDLGNPLPASINITTIEPKYHQSISNFLSQDIYQVYLSNITSKENTSTNAIISSVSKNLITVTSFAHQVVFWLVMIFVIGGVLIMLNAVQITIFNRKKEISVMKLVGSSYWFIRSPFVLESVFNGIMAVIFSFFMLFFVAQKIQIQDNSLFTYFESISFTTIFLAELGITILISVISSMIAVHEYLHKNLLEE